MSSDTVKENIIKKLKNIRVLVTRPAHQAQSLIAEITILGGHAILFPTIEIVDAEDQLELRAQILQLADYQLAIFISPNAVAKTMPLLREIWPIWPSQVKIAAIGAATVESLRQQHLIVNYYPKISYNSEELLALPGLNEVGGKQIMLFRGAGGRELLAATLRDRGAKITEVVAYRRILPKIPKVLPFSQNGIDIIVSTSNTGLQNLLEMCNEMDRTWLQNMSLLVISKRMIPVAKALGFTKPPVLAEDATDSAIVKALVIWQEKVNGECAI